MFLTAGQRSDYIDARALLENLPSAEYLLADRGYDADWHREALEDKGSKQWVPSRKGRKIAVLRDEVPYRKRHSIENIFAGFKVWRQIA